ncbi:MAG: hypothetical protein WDZ57_03785, partial [Demequina sp.]
VAGTAACSTADVEASPSPPPARETSPRPDLPTASATPDPEPIVYERGTGERFVPESVGQAQEDGTAGSGCTPGLEPTLPDGLWRGFVVDGHKDSVEFDLICSWHFTSARFKERDAERDDEGPPAIYVTANDNPQTRDLPLDPDVRVWPHPLPDEPWRIEEFYVQRLQGGWDEVWVFVNDGRVTEIAQVYYP